MSEFVIHSNQNSFVTRWTELGLLLLLVQTSNGLRTSVEMNSLNCILYCVEALSDKQLITMMQSLSYQTTIKHQTI